MKPAQTHLAHHPKNHSSSGFIDPKLLLLVCVLACFAAVGAALIAQYHFNMQPCPWCILQRVIFVLIGLLSILALFTASLPRQLFAGLIFVLADAGIIAALYQHFVAASSNSCNLSVADRIITGLHLDLSFPAVFAVRSSCADAVANILGVPFEFYSLALFALLSFSGLQVLLHTPRR